MKPTVNAVNHKVTTNSEVKTKTRSFTTTYCQHNYQIFIYECTVFAKSAEISNVCFKRVKDVLHSFKCLNNSNPDFWRPITNIIYLEPPLFKHKNKFMNRRRTFFVMVEVMVLIIKTQ